jgi:hypothetical protein
MRQATEEVFSYAGTSRCPDGTEKTHGCVRERRRRTRTRMLRTTSAADGLAFCVFVADSVGACGHGVLHGTTT